MTTRMTPFVTVICPVRNEQEYISQCLESLVNQTYDPERVEILVVDGLSDDHTRDIVRAFRRLHPNIRLVDNPHRIVPCALNIGIREAKGEYILRLDGHAEAANDYVEKCIEVLRNTDVECVGGSIENVNRTATGKAIAHAMSSPFGVGNGNFRTATEERFVDTLAFPAFRRDVLAKCGWFDEELVRCQDDEYNYRIRKRGGRILFTPRIKSCYFPRESYRKLWNQYFGYGLYKIRVLQKHFWLMQPRHFAPAAFILALVLTLAAGLAVPGLGWLFGVLAGFYACCAILAAAVICSRNRAPYFFRILLAFVILHFSYGSGFLCGLVKFAPRWLQREGAPGATLTTEAAP